MAVHSPHVWEVHVGIYFVSWPVIGQVLGPWTWNLPSDCGPAVGSAPGASCFRLVKVARCCLGHCCWSRLEDHASAYNHKDHSCVAEWLGNGNHICIPHNASGSPSKLHRSGDGRRGTETAFVQVSHPQYSVSQSSTEWPVVQGPMAHSHWSDLVRGGTSAGLGLWQYPCRPTTERGLLTGCLHHTQQHLGAIQPN